MDFNQSDPKYTYNDNWIGVYSKANHHGLELSKLRCSAVPANYLFFFEHFLFGSFSMSIFFQTWLTSADEVGGSKKGQKHADVTLEWSLVYLYRKQTIFHEKLN